LFLALEGKENRIEFEQQYLTIKPYKKWLRIQG
jgi:hypothetical protein